MDPTIKILRVIPRYAPAWAFGGSVRFSYDLDAALARRGFEITVCTSDQLDLHRRVQAGESDTAGVSVRRFPNRSNYLAGRLSWLSYRPVGLQRAIADLATRSDLIHVAEARGPHVSWALAAARAARVPLVWTPLGALADGVGLRRPYRWLYDVAHATRRQLMAAGAVVAQSAHEAQWLERLGARPSQVQLIGLGVDERRFADLPPRGAFRKAVGVGPDRTLVLFMGRFHPNKGLDVLLHAVAMARRTHPNLAAVLAGWRPPSACRPRS